MSKQKITKKERNLFFSGILAGMAGSILGNFVVTTLFRVFDIKLRWYNMSIFLISLVSFFSFYYWIYKKIKPIK